MSRITALYLRCSTDHQTVESKCTHLKNIVPETIFQTLNYLLTKESAEQHKVALR
jgi:hypothetical protein